MEEGTGRFQIKGELPDPLQIFRGASRIVTAVLSESRSDRSLYATSSGSSLVQLPGFNERGDGKWPGTERK